MWRDSGLWSSQMVWRGRSFWSLQRNCIYEQCANNATMCHNLDRRTFQQLMDYTKSAILTLYGLQIYNWFCFDIVFFFLSEKHKRPKFIEKLFKHILKKESERHYMKHYSIYWKDVRWRYAIYWTVVGFKNILYTGLILGAKLLSIFLHSIVCHSPNSASLNPSRLNTVNWIPTNPTSTLAKPSKPLLHLLSVHSLEPTTHTKDCRNGGVKRQWITMQRNACYRRRE